MQCETRLVGLVVETYYIVNTKYIFSSLLRLMTVMNVRKRVMGRPLG